MPSYSKIFFGMCFCRCKKYRRYQSLVNDGYRHLMGELDVVRLLRKLRSNKNAIWALTTTDQRKLCRHQARFILKSTN